MIKMRGVFYGIDCIKIFCVTVKVFVFRNFSDRTFKMDHYCPVNNSILSVSYKRECKQFVNLANKY